MKLEKKFTVSCCSFQFSSDWEHESVAKLMSHIRKCHPELVKKINKNARKQAMSQNGCGYWDELSSNYSGWHKATPTFREAWKLNALEKMLDCV